MNSPGQAIPQADKWDSGATYEAYVGRWSRPVAREFLDWLHVPPASRWLDVGCGTGALSQTILERDNPVEVKGIDSSEAHIGFAHQNVVDRRVNFEVGDAQQLPAESSYYDVVVSGLVLNFIPDQNRALREMRRAVKPGGVVAVYVWDYADGMQMMRYFWDAVIALHPDAIEFDENRRFPICNPEPLVALFQSIGLAQIIERSIDVPTHFQNFEDYWMPFLGGQAPAPGYLRSLNEEDRIALRDYIHAHLPVNLDGSIDLTARAWAIRGLRPQ